MITKDARPNNKKGISWTGVLHWMVSMSSASSVDPLQPTSHLLQTRPNQPMQPQSLGVATAFPLHPSSIYFDAGKASRPIETL